jgi:hypothetical protein
MLDFTDYEGDEVEVVGLPLNKVRWNKDRHVVIRSEWMSTDAWVKLALPIAGFFRMRMRRLQTFCADEGIYSLPPVGSKLRAVAEDELKRMIEIGFDVRG